jgi:ribonuclease HI
MKQKRYIYTDGACINNGKKNAIGGIGIYFGEGDGRNLSNRLVSSFLQTNNVSELIAIETALKILIETEDINNNSYIIFTDSDYSIKALTVWIHNWIKKGWINSKREPVKNREIIQRIYEIIQSFKDIKLVHIAAHTGKTDEHSIGNYNADLLASKSVL